MELTRTKRISPVDMELLTIAENWGWSNPPPEILQIAKQAKDAKTLKSAELLVSLGVVTKEQAQTLLSTKPPDIPTIAWFAQQDNTSVPVERVLALMSDYAYYENLKYLSIHPSMKEKEVIKHAEEIDATLMLIDSTIPVIVFSTFAALREYRSLGRAERMEDAILRHIETPKLAVGARDEISAVLKSLREEDATGSLDSANIWNAEAAENKSKVENREITRLLDHAISQGVTDISFKPFRTGEINIQFRKFGQMIAPKAVSSRFNSEMGVKVINLLQAKSGSNPSGTVQRLPTDGQITYRSSVGDVFLRLSFIPLNHLGERRNLISVSIRLLPRKESSVSLDNLRLNDSVVEQINFALRMSQGLILVVGPTSSGKSTTVAGCIGEHVNIFGDTQKRLSVEDPVEQFTFGITQINAPPTSNAIKESERFSVILRAIKRHDPDMISIGEVRDKETADMCVASASTGHLVLSTLHANHTLLGFDVLLNIIDPDKRFQLIESLSMIISQRLIKIVCPHCREIKDATAKDHKLFDNYLALLGEEATLPLTLAHANPDGCERCGKDGYIGLLPINEILPFNRRVKDTAIEILNGKNQRKIIAAARTITLLQSAMVLLKEHKIELTDLLV